MLYQPFFAMLADCYTPCLAVWAGLKLYHTAQTTSAMQAFSQLGLLIQGLIVIYSIMVIDWFAAIWSRFGLDYSSHTAIVLVFGMYILHQIHHLRRQALLIFSMLGYAALMIWLDYHSLADILSTTMVLIPLLTLIFYQTTTRN